MQFGSVEFFKVLIKTVLAIVFFVPLVLCIVFAVLFGIKSSELKSVKQENERLTIASEIIMRERVGTVENYYDLFSDSGLPVGDLIAFINSKTGSNYVQGGTPGGVTPPDTSASSGESKPEASSVPDSSTSEPESSGDESTPSVPVNPDRPYEALYEDMYVRAPAENEYVREENAVYLTFDDGPSAYTYSILQILRTEGVKATFFVVPQRTEGCYEAMRAIVNEGHTIGVHSASHVYNDIYASVDAFLDDFHAAWQMIYEATGVKTEIFRFPGGSINNFNAETRDAIVEEMTRRGFRFFDWNIDSGDVDGATWTDMYNSIPGDISQVYRAVVLMHDSVNTINTIYVLEDVIKVLKNEGYHLDKINNNTKPIQFTGPFA